jgi:drug/metabolite transporter (DMT)-like permease
VEIEEDVIRLCRHHPDRTVLLLLALYACWGSAIPAMKLMVGTVPPVGGAALVFLLAGVVLAGAARGRPRPTRVQLRQLAVAGVLLLVGGQGLATVALTAVTASLGAILAAAIPLWVVLLSGLTGIRVSVASWVRLVAGFGGIMIVVLTAPDSAIGGAPWAVAAFCVAPILWAAGSLLTANVDRPVDRVVASAVQLLAGGTVLLLVALSLGELDPTRWSDVSWTSAGAAVFLLVFDSLAGFMLYTRLLESAPAPLVSTYAYVTPLVGAVIGATVLDEALWAGAFVGGALVLGAVALELRGPMRPRPRWDGPEHRPGATESHAPHFPDHLRRSLPATGRRRSHLSAASGRADQSTADCGGSSLVEHPERPHVVDVTTYYLRNQDVVDVADELLAFQVNASGGTQDTVDKARLKGIRVVVFTYQS